jgi:hypothetical protein
MRRLQRLYRRMASDELRAPIRRAVSVLKERASLRPSWMARERSGFASGTDQSIICATAAPIIAAKIARILDRAQELVSVLIYVILSNYESQDLFLSSQSMYSRSSPNACVYLSTLGR